MNTLQMKNNTYPIKESHVEKARILLDDVCGSYYCMTALCKTGSQKERITVILRELGCCSFSHSTLLRQREDSLA